MQHVHAKMHTTEAKKILNIKLLAEKKFLNFEKNSCRLELVCNLGLHIFSFSAEFLLIYVPNLFVTKNNYVLDFYMYNREWQQQCIFLHMTPPC